MLKLFTAGSRTYVLSVVVLICALFLGADSKGILDLSPMTELILQTSLVIVAPLVPVFIRKAIANMQKK